MPRKMKSYKKSPFMVGYQHGFDDATGRKPFVPRQKGSDYREGYHDGYYEGLGGYQSKQANEFADWWVREWMPWELSAEDHRKAERRGIRLPTTEGRTKCKPWSPMRNPYPNEHAARIRQPGAIRKNTYRSKTISPGVRLIIGKLKVRPMKKPKKGTGSRKADPTVVQAIRFDNSMFTAPQARAWLNKYGIEPLKFEAATATQLQSLRTKQKRAAAKKRKRTKRKIA